MLLSKVDERTSSILQCSKVLLLTDEDFKLSYASGITCKLRIFHFLKIGEWFETKISGVLHCGLAV